MHSLGQTKGGGGLLVGGRPLLANYTALQSAIVAFEGSRLTQAVVRATSGVPANTIVRVFQEAKAKLNSSSPSEMSEVEFFAILLGTLTQARTDLVNAKLFMYSPAAGNAAARAKFEQIMGADLQMLQQVASLMNTMLADRRLPALVSLVGGTAGLGFVMLAIDSVRLVWQGLMVWRVAQRQRELWLRQQIALCEELTSRGTPCTPERVGELRGELEQIVNTPAARFIDNVGEGARAAGEGIGNFFDKAGEGAKGAGEGLGKGLKIGIATLSIGAGLIALWWAWPLISSTRRKPRTRKGDDEGAD